TTGFIGFAGIDGVVGEGSVQFPHEKAGARGDIPWRAQVEVPVDAGGPTIAGELAADHIWHGASDTAQVGIDGFEADELRAVPEVDATSRSVFASQVVLINGRMIVRSTGTCVDKPTGEIICMHTRHEGSAGHRNGQYCIRLVH